MRRNGWRVARWSLAVLAVLLCGAAVALPGQPGAPIVVPLAVRFIPVSGGTFINAPALIPGSQRVVVAFASADAQNLGGLWLDTVDLTNGVVARLAVPDPTCRLWASNFPAPLPNGWIGYVEDCSINSDGSYRSPEQATRLMAYDPLTGGAALLLPYYLPFHALSFSFAPGGRVGIFDDGDGLHEQLRWLYPDHQALVGLPFARVGPPAWSPDGKEIAVVAAPLPGDAPGVERLDLPATLYLVSPATLRIRPLVTGLVVDSSLSWSPDGRWLVGQLTFGGEGIGLWLVDSATGHYYRLAMPGDVGNPTWLSDGRTVVATVGAAGKLAAPPQGRVGLDVITLPDLAPFTSSAA